MSDQSQWETTPENTPTEILNKYTSEFIEQLRKVELIKTSLDGEDAAFHAAEQTAKEAHQAAEEAVSVCGMVEEISEALRLKEEAARIAAGLPPTPVGELPGVASQLLTPLSGADAASEELVLAREARINAEKGQLQLKLSAAMSRLKAELAAIRQSLAKESRTDAENRLLIADAESKIIFAQLDILRKYEPVWVIEKKLGELLAEQHKMANRANDMSNAETFLATARKDLAKKIAELSRDLRPYEKALNDAREREAEAAHVYEAELASSGPDAENTIALELKLTAMKLARSKAEEERDAAKAIFQQYLSQLEQDTGRYVNKYQQETLAIWEQSNKQAKVIAEQQTQYSRALHTASQSIHKEDQGNQDLDHIIKQATAHIREIHRETLILVEQLQPALAEIGLAIKDIKGRKDLITGDNGDLIHQAYLLISSSGEVAGQAAQTRYEIAYLPSIPPLNIPDFPDPHAQEPCIIARPELDNENLEAAVKELIQQLAAENALQTTSEEPETISDAEVSERETERLLRAGNNPSGSAVPTAVRLAFLEGIARAEAVEAETNRQPEVKEPQPDATPEQAEAPSIEQEDARAVSNTEPEAGDNPDATAPAHTTETPVEDDPPAENPAVMPDENLVVNDETALDEEPAINEEPAPGDEPMVNEEPAPGDEPMVNEEPAPGDEPAVNEEPAPGEEPAINQEPEPAPIKVTRYALNAPAGFISEIAKEALPSEQNEATDDTTITAGEAKPDVTDTEAEGSAAPTAKEPETETASAIAAEAPDQPAPEPENQPAEIIEQTLIIELDKKAARAGVSRAVRKAFREGMSKAEPVVSEEQPDQPADSAPPKEPETTDIPEAKTTETDLPEGEQQDGEPQAAAETKPAETPEKKPKFGNWLRGRKKAHATPAKPIAVDKNPEEEAARVSAEIEEMRQKLAAVTFSKRKEQEVLDRKQRKEQEEKLRLAEEESARIRIEEEQAQKEAEELEAKKREEQRQAALEMEKLAENLAAAVELIEQKSDIADMPQMPAAKAKPAAAKPAKKTSRRTAAPPPPAPADDNDDSDLEIELRRLILSDFKKNNS